MQPLKKSSNQVQYLHTIDFQDNSNRFLMLCMYSHGTFHPKQSLHLIYWLHEILVLLLLLLFDFLWFDIFYEVPLCEHPAELPQRFFRSITVHHTLLSLPSLFRSLIE